MYLDLVLLFENGDCCNHAEMDFKEKLLAFLFQRKYSSIFIEKCSNELH